MSRGDTVIVKKETTIYIFSYCRNLARGKSLNAVYVQLWSRKKKDKKCASIQRYENHLVVRYPQWRLFKMRHIKSTLILLGLQVQKFMSIICYLNSEPYKKTDLSNIDNSRRLIENLQDYNPTH